MKFSREDPGHERIATFDIETTHYEPTEGEIVSIGVGVHERGTPGSEATYDTFYRNGNGESELIQEAMNQLTDYEADGLVSYRGLDFDMKFIGGRLQELGETIEPPEIATSEEHHIDLFVDRQRRASQEGKKWPSLEECLETCGYPCPVTEWAGEVITNTRFGKEIGPAYLSELGSESQRASRLRDAIEHYLTTDLEANVALYYADIGEDFEPHYLGSKRAF